MLDHRQKAKEKHRQVTPYPLGILRTRRVRLKIVLGSNQQARYLHPVSLPMSCDLHQQLMGSAPRCCVWTAMSQTTQTQSQQLFIIWERFTFERGFQVCEVEPVIYKSSYVTICHGILAAEKLRNGIFVHFLQYQCLPRALQHSNTAPWDPSTTVENLQSIAVWPIWHAEIYEPTPICSTTLAVQRTPLVGS